MMEKSSRKKEKEGIFMAMTDKIEVLTHSSIRITGEKIVYIDPFKIKGETHDADLILITHDHYDHFSPEDIARVSKEDTRLAVPEKMEEQATEIGFSGKRLITVTPGMAREIDGILVEAVEAYNNLKPFHPKKKGWVGYILSIAGERIYIAGDTDMTKENQQVKCDVALIPIGGTYTMDAKKAAELVNVIRPKTAIPTHYGSIVGSRKDEEIFRKNVDAGIEVVIRMRDYQVK